MKRILIISGIIFLIFAVALGLYYFILQKNNNVFQNNKTTPVDYFPFENTSGVNGNVSTTTTDSTQDLLPIENFEKKLRLISNEPVSGSTFVETKEGDYIRYMEKATGHIYDVSTFDEKRVRISNKTIPQISETIFANNGDSFIARYIKNGDVVENFYGNLVGTSTEKTISGQILDTTIKSLSVSPSSKIVFYLDDIRNQGYGFTQTPPKTERKQVFVSKMKQFNIDFVSDKFVALVTKPNSNVLGYLYLLNISTGKTQAILQKISGLTTKVSPNNNFILYTDSSNSNYSLYLNAKTTEIKPLNPKTLPEKCAFDIKKENIVYCGVPRGDINGESLDDWYFGFRSFNDDIWKYDLLTGITERVQNLEEAERNIDITDIKINKNNSYIIFTSKIDGSLWSLNIID